MALVPNARPVETREIFLAPQKVLAINGVSQEGRANQSLPPSSTAYCPLLSTVLAGSSAFSVKRDLPRDRQSRARCDNRQRNRGSNAETNSPADRFGCAEYCCHVHKSRRPQRILHSAPKARNVKAWGIAPGKDMLITQALKARNNPRVRREYASILVVDTYPFGLQHKESRTVYHNCHRTGATSIHG